MKYFLHDTSASDDEKISELFLNFGYEGTGLFFAILERLGKQEKPIKTTVLKAQLKVGKRLEKLWLFMENLGVISSTNGETFNERILSYHQSYEIKKEKNRKKISEWRENQHKEKNVTSYEPVSNSPKVNKSKVNKEIDNNTAQSKIFTIKKDKKILFRESKYFDFATFENAFYGSEYQQFDLKHYHEAALNWSDGNGEKKIDWIATVKTWISRDNKKTQNGTSTTQSLFAGNNGKLSRNDATIRALKDY